MTKRLSPEDITGIAESLGCTPAQIRSVIEVETNGKPGFLGDGRPRILYEPHVFFRRTGGRYGEREPVSTRSWGTFAYGTLNEQWRRFNLAADLDRNAAIEACSWGLFQVLGENWKSLDYKNAEHFFDCMHRSEGDHLDAFRRFVRNNQLVEALKRGKHDEDSWVDFARRYNGPAFATHGYHTRLAAAYRRQATESDRRYQALLDRGDEKQRAFDI